MTPLRVVLDTNCVVSALMSSRSRFAWLREGWQSRRFVALASTDTANELLRVLHYPKFRLSREEQETLLGEYLPYVEAIQVDTRSLRLPSLRDSDDAIFLALVAAAHADALVTGDGDLHAVKTEFRTPILTVAEFAERLQRH